MVNIRCEGNNVLVNGKSRLTISRSAQREFFKHITEATIVVCGNPDNLLTPAFVDAGTHHVSIIRSSEGTHLALSNDAEPLPENHQEDSLLLLQARKYDGKVIYELFYTTPRLPSEMLSDEEE